MSYDTLLRNAAAQVEAKRPDLNPSIVEGVAAIRSQNMARATAGVQQMRQQAMQMPRAERRHWQRRVGMMQKMAQYNAQQQVVAQYGEDGKHAWQALDKEMHRPGIIERVIKLFFNSDAQGATIGGIRPGGIIGGALGLMAALKFGGPENGIMGIIATVVATVAGAWAGNNLADSAVGAISPSSPDPTPDPMGLARAPIVARGPATGVAPTPPDPIPPPSPTTAARHAVPPGSIGTLSSPPKVNTTPPSPENWRRT